MLLSIGSERRGDNEMACLMKLNALYAGNTLQCYITSHVLYLIIRLQKGNFLDLSLYLEVSVTSLINLSFYFLTLYSACVQ